MAKLQHTPLPSQGGHQHSHVVHVKYLKQTSFQTLINTSTEEINDPCVVFFKGKENIFKTTAHAIQRTKSLGKNFHFPSKYLDVMNRLACLCKTTGLFSQSDYQGQWATIRRVITLLATLFLISVFGPGMLNIQQLNKELSSEQIWYVMISLALLGILFIHLKWIMCPSFRYIGMFINSCPIHNYNKRQIIKW